VSIHAGESSAVESDHRTHSIPDAAVTLFYGASIPPKSDMSDSLTGHTVNYGVPVIFWQFLTCSKHWQKGMKFLHPL
jgi:hypothetical protein